MFVHPRCVCSRASLAELARLQARVGDRLATDIAFVGPFGTDEELLRSGLWAQAALIPGARSQIDRDGREAARFGAGTSGAVVLYGADGLRRFEGGITALRGHEGASPGQERIVELVRSDREGAARAPVFGCPLVEPAGPELAQEAHRP